MKSINRIMGIVSFMLVIVVMGAFANGQSDQAGAKGNRAGFEKKEAVSLTGTVTLTNRMAIELLANGKTYFLLVPRHLAFEAGIKDGDTVSVSGNIVVAPNAGSRFGKAGLEPLVLVDKATINGKEYDLKDYAGKGRGGYGGRFGGRRGGPGCGPSDCPYRDGDVK